MSYTRAIQTSHASDIPWVTSGYAGPGVDTVDILTRGREDNVVCRNTRDGKLGRIDLDQHVKAVEIGHTRYVDPKIDMHTVCNHGMAGRGYKDCWSRGRVRRWKGQ